MERFEEICRLYINSSDAVKNTILSMLDENQKQTFLEGVGLYKMFTQPDFYEAVQNAIGKQLYEEFNK